MIKASDIYAASHDGLDIILYYYPQAEGCVDNRKKFKIRPDEDDASACIRKYGDCYKVTDFGDQGTATSPIDICMREEHVSFGEAVVLLAARYNVSIPSTSLISARDRLRLMKLKVPGSSNLKKRLLLSSLPYWALV